MMKKFFIFYKEYEDIFNTLIYPKNVFFMDILCKTLLKDGSSSQHIKEINFEDEDLKSAWDKIILFKEKRDRNTPEYKQWRIEVYKRDMFICQSCFKSGIKLNAHHIIRWADDKSKRYDLKNGVTLCESCHKEAHK